VKIEKSIRSHKTQFIHGHCGSGLEGQQEDKNVENDGVPQRAKRGKIWFPGKEITLKQENKGKCYY